MFKLLGVYLNFSAWFMKNMSVTWKSKKLNGIIMQHVFKMQINFLTS